MNDKHTPTPILPDSEAPTPEAAPAAAMRRGGWLAAISLVVCVAAWFLIPISGFGAMACALVAIVIAAVALRGRRAAVRNTAITVIIAAAVLIVVVGLFIFTLYQLLD